MKRGLCIPQQKVEKLKSALSNLGIEHNIVFDADQSNANRAIWYKVEEIELTDEQALFLLKELA